MVSLPFYRKTLLVRSIFSCQPDRNLSFDMNDSESRALLLADRIAQAHTL